MTFQHVIVIKRSIHEQHPWLARSVTKAFASSLEYAYDAISERAALRYMLPWLQDHVEETRKCVRNLPLGISSNDRWLLFRREPSGHLALIGIGKTVWKRISMSSKSSLNIHMGRVWPRNCGNPRRYTKSSGTAGCADVIEIYRSSLLALRSHMSFDEICSYKVSCNITCKIILLETEVWGFLLSPHLDAGRQSLPH